MDLKKRFMEFVRFGIIGGVSTIFDWTTFILMVRVFSINYQISLVLAYSVGAIINYIGNRKITFKSKDKKITKQFSIFTAIVIVNLFISMALLEMFVELGVGEILSRIIVTGIIFVLNYFAHKFITFNENLTFSIKRDNKIKKNNKKTGIRKTK